MVPSVSNVMVASTLESTLGRGYQVLRHYDAHTKFARRCSSILKSLQQKILFPQSAQSFTSSQAPEISHRAPFGSQHTEPTADGTEIDFSSFDPNGEDFSWLETQVFEWDNESSSLYSLDGLNINAVNRW